MAEQNEPTLEKLQAEYTRLAGVCANADRHSGQFKDAMAQKLRASTALRAAHIKAKQAEAQAKAKTAEELVNVDKTALGKISRKTAS